MRKTIYFCRCSDDLIINCADKLGVTSIVVTHDMASAFKVGDNIAMLHEGKVIFTGTPEEVRRTNVRQFVEGSLVR